MVHGGGTLSWPIAASLWAAAAGYLAALIAARRAGRWWPPWRTACWYAGLLVAAAAATAPGHGFAAHMTGHLLLGMAAPVLLVLAAPVTLVLRALPVRRARTLSHVLAGRPVRVLTHPVTAAALDAGGLWVLYTTGLFAVMAERPWVHLLVQAHVLAAGYLFTASMIGVDPAPHRPGRRFRAVVLVAFAAAHAMLAKHLYGHPPAGVLPAGGRAGAELMYYGGDLIDLVLIVVFCRQWYAATDPHRRRGPAVPASGTPRPWRLPEELRIGGDPAAPAARAGPAG